MNKNVKSKIFILCFQISILCLMTACSPKLATSPSSSYSSPHITEHTFVSFDNTELPLRMWLPVEEIKGVVIAVHGFNDYSNFIKDSASCPALFASLMYIHLQHFAKQQVQHNKDAS